MLESLRSHRARQTLSQLGSLLPAANAPSISKPPSILSRIQVILIGVGIVVGIVGVLSDA